MGLLNTNEEACREFRAQLEDAAASAPGLGTLPGLLAALPVSLSRHASSCASCRAAAEELTASRAKLAARPSSANLGGPWFPSRVMAAIAARKAELARAADTWTFLPKLAARLTWVSSIVLLLASAWLYQRPVSKPVPSAHVAIDITGEPIPDTSAPAVNDDVLVSLAEKAR